jgi:hypothetical protein
MFDPDPQLSGVADKSDKSKGIWSYCEVSGPILTIARWTDLPNPNTEAKSQFDLAYRGHLQIPNPYIG